MYCTCSLSVLEARRLERCPPTKKRKRSGSALLHFGAMRRVHRRIRWMLSRVTSIDFRLRDASACYYPGSTKEWRGRDRQLPHSSRHSISRRGRQGTFAPDPSREGSAVESSNKSLRFSSIVAGARPRRAKKINKDVPCSSGLSRPAVRVPDDLGNEPRYVLSPPGPATAQGSRS